MSQPTPESSEALLRATPYLIADGEAARTRFEKVAGQATTIRARATTVADKIAKEAEQVLPQFDLAVRSDLVAESNRMEGIETSPVGLRDLARVRQELLQMEVHHFLAYVRDDPRVLESLGLLRAYGIADEWARAQNRPREFELRQLHELVMPMLDSAGRYKSAANWIGGSDHVPVPHWDTSRAMTELADWFVKGSGDAVLDAAVVHAWLTHVHPFDDGNGRMARLLANLALVQSGYPPLLLRSGSDRGQYLDALAASDDGDILPLYDLFVKSLRRIVAVMEKPNYVESKIRNDLLATVSQRHRYWRGLASDFASCLASELARRGWRSSVMGYPSVEDFALLEERDASGNCWFTKLRARGEDRWLLWFGYRSREMVDLLSGRRPWPSCFFSERTDDPRAVHPFEPRFQADGQRPAEICFMPGRRRPVLLRWSYETRELEIEEAVKLVAGSICK